MAMSRGVEGSPGAAGARGRETMRVAVRLRPLRPADAQAEGALAPVSVDRAAGTVRAAPSRPAATTNG